MFKKRSPLLQRVSRLLKVPILISRLGKPIIPLKKSSWKMKKSMLLRHNYNYGYVKEYEFSPSNSPFIQNYYYRRNPILKKKGHIGNLLFLGKCLGRKKNYPLEVKVLPCIENTLIGRGYVSSEFSEEEADDDSIDERAEKFIEKFYEDMRLQRQHSVLRSNALMLHIDG